MPDLLEEQLEDQHFEKMAQPIVLAPPEMTEAYRQQILLTRPEVRKMSKLDQAMADILAETNIDSFKKMEKYYAVLREFMNVRDDVARYGTAIQPPPTIQTSTVSEAETGDETAPQVTALVEVIKQLILNPAKKRKLTNKNAGSKRSKVSTQADENNDLNSATVDDEIGEAIDSTEPIDSAESTPKATNKLMRNLFATSGIKSTTPVRQFKIEPFYMDEVALKKLKKQFTRQNKFKDDPAYKEVHLGNETIPRDVWEKTLNLLTSKNAPKMDIPLPVAKTANKIYSFMIEHSMDTEPYLKNSNYPLFEEIVKYSPEDVAKKRRTVVSNAPSKKGNKKKNTKQSGRGYSVDWKKWDKNIPSKCFK